MNKETKDKKWISFQQAKLEEELYRQMHNDWVIKNFYPFVHPFLMKPPQEEDKLLS